MAKKKKQNNGSIFQKLEKKAAGKNQTLGLDSLEQVTDFVLGIKKETYIKTAGVFLFLYGILSVFSLFNLGGFVGQKSFDFFTSLFGFWGYLSSIPFFYISFYLLKVRLPKVNFLKFGGFVLFVLSTLSFYSLLNKDSSEIAKTNLDFSGFIGHFFSEKSINLFSLYPSFIFSFVLSFLGLFIAFDYFPKPLSFNIKDIWPKAVSCLKDLSFSTFSVSDFYLNIKDRFNHLLTKDDSIEQYHEEDLENDEDIRSEILYKKPRREKKIVSEEKVL